jgi:hypothetical protein
MTFKTIAMKYIYNEIYIILFNKCYIMFNYIVFHEALVIKFMKKKLSIKI